MISEICIRWSIEDVQSRDKSLTAYEASQVLEFLESNHDATIGINWDVIDAAIEALTPYRMKREGKNV